MQLVINLFCLLSSPCFGSASISTGLIHSLFCLHAYSPLPPSSYLRWTPIFATSASILRTRIFRELTILLAVLPSEGNFYLCLLRHVSLFLLLWTSVGSEHQSWSTWADILLPSDKNSNYRTQCTFFSEPYQDLKESYQRQEGWAN